MKTITTKSKAKKLKSDCFFPFALELVLWQYRLRSFQERNTKLERLLPENELLSNEIIEFRELE